MSFITVNGILIDTRMIHEITPVSVEKFLYHFVIRYIGGNERKFGVSVSECLRELGYSNCILSQEVIEDAKNLAMSRIQKAYDFVVSHWVPDSHGYPSIKI